MSSHTYPIDFTFETANGGKRVTRWYCTVGTYEEKRKPVYKYSIMGGSNV